MTKLLIFSDTHNEFEPPRRPTAACQALDDARHALPGHPSKGPLLDQAGPVDLVLMGGDIDVGARGIAYADAVHDFVGAPVVSIAGNHEAYNGDLDQTIATLREAAAGSAGHVTFLQNDSVEPLPGVYVLGCTLWTDYEANGSGMEAIGNAMAKAMRHLNDHGLIRSKGRWFGADDALRLHQESIQWLRDETARIRADDPNAKVIIMTHHAPVLDANLPMHQGGDLAPAFVSDLRGLIADVRPNLWVSGHTHHDIDITIDATRCVSAQRGYIAAPGAEEFRPMVIDL